MPKLINKFVLNIEDTYAQEELMKRYKSELKDRYGDFVRPGDIAEYLDICYKTAHRILRGQYKTSLPPVRHACGTKKYHTIDVARRLADLSVMAL